METTRPRDIAITALAPMAWGSTYIVTEMFLPPDRPLLAATLRALPAGLVLLALRRQLPHGQWWWKALVLGTLNIAMFFPLIFLAAYNLPGGLASTVQALLPLVVMAMAWPVLSERPTSPRLVGGVVGLIGVALLVLRGGAQITTLGLIGAFGSVLVSALGFVLVKRWKPPVDGLTALSWQLVIGGLILLPVGLLVEGPPPAMTSTNLLGYLWLGSAGTAIAYWVWFRGLTKMTAGSVALIGLINPVVGTVLGVTFADELFGWPQAIGMGLVLGGVLYGQRVATPKVPDSPADLQAPGLELSGR